MSDEVSSDRVLVILLGASEWPKAPEFTRSDAFVNSAQAIRDYFLDESGFGLPEGNLHDLFDSDRSGDDIDESVGKWLEGKLGAPGEGEGITDLLVIYIGHGDF